jgi:hypothetical protein
MILEFHDSLKDPARVHATRLLVRDELGTPIAALVQLRPDHVRIVTASDPDFNQHLAELGLLDTVLVTRHELDRLRPPRLEGR